MKKRVNTIFAIICIVDIIVSLILIDAPGINIAVIIISLFFFRNLILYCKKAFVFGGTAFSDKST